MALKAPLTRPGQSVALGAPHQNEADLESVFNTVRHNNPSATPLQPGESADPTYLAFLRGAGFQQNEAVQLALQQMQTARGTYQTASSRLPDQLHQAQEATDTGLLDRGSFFSGERLRRETQNVVANQEAGQDLASQQASAIQGAQNDLQSKLATLAQQRAEAEGSLVDRQEQRANQNKYIGAVAAGNSSGGGGGGGFSLPPLPAAPPAPPQTAVHVAASAGGQPAFSGNINDYLASPGLHTYLAGLDNQGQSSWLKFVQAQYPGADFRPVLQTLAGIQTNQRAGQQQANNQQSLRGGGPGQGY